MISVGSPLCCTQVEMALMPSQEINPFITGHSAVAAHTHITIHLHNWAHGDCANWRSLSLFSLCLQQYCCRGLSLSCCEYHHRGFTKKNPKMFKTLLYFQTIWVAGNLIPLWSPLFVFALCNSIVRFYVLGNKNSRMYPRKSASWHVHNGPNPCLTFRVSSVLDQSKFLTKQKQ